MRKIGFMGGTFDPIHNAHIELAKQAKKQYNLNEVIFMTSGEPPHKKNRGVTDKLLRYEMVKRAVEDIDGFSASDFEIKESGSSYSLNTLLWLKERYPEDKICFILGEDSLSDIDKWYKTDRIMRLCTLLVYPRHGMETLEALKKRTEERYNTKIMIIDAPIYHISSTNIRNMIKDGSDVSDLLPPQVYKYIKENGIYDE